MAATFTITLSDMIGGPWMATWGARDLGAIGPDGLSIRYSEERIQFMADQFGSTILKERNAGASLEFDLAIAEFDLDNFRDILTNSLHYVQASPSREKVIAPDVVSSAREYTGTALLLHPLELDTSDTSKDITIHLANFSGAMEMAMKSGEQTLMKVGGLGYGDPNNNGRIVTIGDTATVDASPT